MTFTAQQLRIDPQIARKGEYVRFDCMRRRVLEVVDYLSNGLGFTVRANGDGTFTKVVF